MPRGETAKRACQRCEYMNPRQALYCLRCGEIFRPVLAETPWEYLRPEREQRRAEVLGKAALHGLTTAATSPQWYRPAVAALLLGAAFSGLFGWSVRRALSRMVGAQPAAVAASLWNVHQPN